jgi:uncharacterized protein
MQQLLVFILSPLFYVPALTVVFAQITKQIIFYAKGEKISRATWVTDGGMPSSHSALMSSLTTTIFFVEGISTIFYLALFTTFIVAKDAFGIRQQSGKQAKLLLKVVHKVKVHDMDHIKVLLGHTKTQVLAGIIFGVTIAMIFHFFT